MEQSNDEDDPEMTSSIYLLVSSYDQICVALHLHLYDSLLSFHPVHTKLKIGAISYTDFTKIVQGLCLKPVSSPKVLPVPMAKPLQSGKWPYVGLEKALIAVKSLIPEHIWLY